MTAFDAPFTANKAITEPSGESWRPLDAGSLTPQ